MYVTDIGITFGDLKLAQSIWNYVVNSIYFTTNCYNLFAVFKFNKEKSSKLAVQVAYLQIALGLCLSVSMMLFEVYYFVRVGI
jgi:hypothetical protein